MMLAFDISVSKWMAYAFSMIVEKPVYALIVILLTCGILFGLAYGLARAWNKQWDMGSSRFWKVLFFSGAAALCLAAINGLHGGDFFNMKVSTEMMRADGLTAAELKDEVPSVIPVIRGVQVVAADVDDKLKIASDPTKIYIEVDEKLVYSYSTALTILWLLFACFVVGLMAYVSCSAYSDIKVDGKSQ